VSGPVFMFCASELIFDGTEGIGSYFHVCAPRHVFGDTEGVGTRFHVLLSRTNFGRCRVRLVPFSCFARPDSLSAVPRVSDPVFIFFAPVHVLGSAEGVGSNFHVLRSQTRFEWYRGHQVLFSCFARRDSFSTVPRASTPIFIFFRSWTRFRRYQGHRVPFSCFAIRGTFWAVPRASGLDIMFCAPGLVFSGTEGNGSCFHVS
jgi:hypothetical protein